MKRAIKFLFSYTFIVPYFVIVYLFVGKSLSVPTPSMEKTIIAGDRIVVKNFQYGVPNPKLPLSDFSLIPGIKGDFLFMWSEPKRGDIVNFRSPLNNSNFFVKRCVAVGGDKLFLRNKNLYLLPKEGNSFVKNNYPLQKIVKDKEGRLWVKNPYQSFIKHDNNVTKQNSDKRVSVLFDTRVVNVPKNTFFMMGDNRDHSYDSRFWGPVSKDLIDSKVVKILHSEKHKKILSFLHKITTFN